MAAGIRQQRNDSALRLLASRGAKWVRAALLADTHPDSGCGIKILPRSLFLELPFFNHMHRFMPSLVRRHGGIVLGCRCHIARGWLARRNIVSLTGFWLVSPMYSG